MYLRDWIIALHEKKRFPAHLCLDTGCTLVIEKIKPLVIVLNALVDNLRSVSTQEIHIDLEAHQKKDQLVLIVHTDRETKPIVKTTITDAIHEIGAEFYEEFMPKQYLKYQLTFSR